MIDIKDVITLNDNNEYAVCSKTKFQDEEYLYLIDINNNENFKFGLIKQNGESINIIELENQQLIQQLLPLFFENSKHLLNEIEN
jgi:hypothetical protein